MLTFDGIVFLLYQSCNQKLRLGRVVFRIQVDSNQLEIFQKLEFLWEFQCLGLSKLFWRKTWLDFDWWKMIVPLEDLFDLNCKVDLKVNNKTRHWIILAHQNFIGKPILLYVLAHSVEKYSDIQSYRRKKMFTIDSNFIEMKKS